MTDMTDDDAAQAENEALDPVLAAILRVLWEHARQHRASTPESDAEPDRRRAPAADPSAEDGKAPDNGLSLARISKRAGVQMSVLRRVLTQLADADLARVAMEEDGRGAARLTEEGGALCEQLFDAPEPGDERGQAPVRH
jgi:hypothetical protein